MVNSIPHSPPTPCGLKRTQGANVPFTASSVHIVEGQLFVSFRWQDSSNAHI